MNDRPRNQRGLLEALLSDGRPVLTFMGLCLALAGGFAVFQSATGHFLPHDAEYLGMDAKQLCALNQCRVVHDRASFGGALLTCAIVWLACVWCGTPSRSLWQALCASGSIGFLAAVGIHLIVGYVDFVHLTPALAGALIFALGIALSRKSMCSDAKRRVSTDFESLAALRMT
jgi:hypothetical protein